MNKYSSLTSSWRQIGLSLLLILSLNLEQKALIMMLLIACLIEAGKGLAQVRSIKADTKEQLENKLFSREFYPMPSPYEEADIQRLRCALKSLS